MITPEIIARINELAKKQREGVLSDLERAEQTRLRRIYIDNIKNQVKAAIDTGKKDTHSSDCHCGCHEQH